MSELRSLPTDGLVRICDVAPGLGLTSEGLTLALRRQGAHIYKQGRRNAVSIERLERLVAEREYRAPNLPKRPAGWWKTSVVCEEMGVKVRVVENLQKEGRLEAVRVGKNYYYNPDSVRRCRQEREAVPPGWIALIDLAAQQGWADSAGLPRQARRLGLRVAHYRDPAAKRGSARRACIHRADVPALIEHVSLPERYAGRLTTEALAAATGVSGSLALRWMRQGLCGLRSQNGAWWIDPQEAVAWLRLGVCRTYPRYAEVLSAHLEQQAAPERAA